MLRVRHDVSSAALVRQALAADLTRNAITPDSVDDVVLVVSELVGNAVTHVDGLEDVSVQWSLEPHAPGATEAAGLSVLLQVADGSTTRPQPRTAAATATSGRGLAIVAALAAEWGVHDAAHGKRVWARIPVRRTG